MSYCRIKHKNFDVISTQTSLPHNLKKQFNQQTKINHCISSSNPNTVFSRPWKKVEQLQDKISS